MTSNTETGAPLTPGELFRAYQHRTKKRFGQHFLVDPQILDEITVHADIQSGDQVFEIGPGCGTLSLMLLRRGATVKAVELDRDAAAFLRESLEPHYPFELVEADAMSVDFDELLGAQEVPWKVVANLPYNVGTEILFRLLEEGGGRLESMTLMFQREVAQRIVATAGEDGYGALSLMVQLHSEVHYGMTLAPGAFVPPPKVHSAIVQFLPIRGTRIEDPILRKRFKKIVKGAFQMRRKTLTNGLRALGYEKDVVEGHLKAMGLGAKVRPERISFEDFEALTRRLHDGDEE